MILLYPQNPLMRKLPEPVFEAEYDAATEIGFHCLLFAEDVLSTDGSGGVPQMFLGASHVSPTSVSDRSSGPLVIRNQRSQLRRSLNGLRREGFRHVFVLESPDQVEAAVLEEVQP